MGALEEDMATMSRANVLDAAVVAAAGVTADVLVATGVAVDSAARAAERECSTGYMKLRKRQLWQL